MRKIFLYDIAMVPMLSLTLGGCSIEMSDNGELDGYWHLERVDTLSTGGVCDLSGQLRFWAVQAKMLALMDRGNDANGGAFGYLLRFEHNGSKLRLYQPLLNDRVNGDSKVEDAKLLAPFGVNALDETFRVVSLSGSKMTLRTEELQLSFKKF